MIIYIYTHHIPYIYIGTIIIYNHHHITLRFLVFPWTWTPNRDHHAQLHLAQALWSSFQEFSHLFSDEITYYIYIYIYICVYIDICQSEIQQIQDHKNLIAPIRFQITQCITPNPKGHLSSHLQGRGVVDHDGIPHLQPWSKFQHPTQLSTHPVDPIWMIFITKSKQCFTEVGTRPWTSSQSLQWVLLIVCKAWCGNNLSIFCWEISVALVKGCAESVSLKSQALQTILCHVVVCSTRPRTAECYNTTKMVR